MSSSLNNSLSSFRKDISDAASRNAQHSRPASTAPARTSTPKPAGDSSKRTHDSAFPPASSAPPIGQTGNELLSQVFTAVNYLRDKNFRPVAFDDLIGYLSLPHDQQKQVPLIKKALHAHDRTEYIPASESSTRKDSFKYRPIYPVTNAEELKTFLRIQPTAQGILAKDLKDGWPDAFSALNDLEKAGHILVLRMKKDDSPRMIWADAPDYHILNPRTQMPEHVAPDFCDVWNKTRMPANENETRMELEKAGLTPTSAVKDVVRADQGKKQRKKVVRKGGKTTNSHLLGVLKDYSAKR